MSKQFNNKFGKTATKAAIAIALVGATTVGAHAASLEATTTANLHMRTGEGTGYKIVETISKGQKVEVLNNNGSWWKVKHNDKVGYSYKNYLRVVNNKEVVKEVKVKVETSLNVRTGASTGYKIIGKLHNGDKLQVTGQKGNWYEVKYKGNVAYVSSDFCVDVNNSTNNEGNHESTNTNETVKVTCNRLNLRKGASTNHRVIATLDQGKKLIVQERLSNGWLKVKVDGKVGYVSGKYTAHVNENNNTNDNTNTSIDKTIKITAGSLNVREGSSVAYAIKGYVHQGQTFKAVAKASNGWYKIQLANGEFGWISGRFADEVSSTKPEQPTNPEKPGQGEETKPEQPTNPEKPGEGNKPGEETKPEQPTNPEKPGEGETEKPGQGGDTEKPGEPEVKPGDGDDGKDDPSLIPPTNQAPRITFDNVTVNEGEKFDISMLHIKAIDPEDGELSSDKIKVEADVNTDKPGAYVIKISATDKDGYESVVHGVVTVKAKEIANEAPTLFVEGTTIEQGSEFNYNMLKYSAEDKEDGNLTDKIVFTGNVDTNKPGVYEITASVSDSKGVTAKTIVKVTVVAKNNAPHIAGEDVTIKEGEKFSYDMLKIDAIDKEDGVITENVKFEGNVDTNKPGVYVVKATVTDSKGLSTTESFKVTVVAKEVEVNNAPVINCVDTYTMSPGDKFDVEMLGATAHDKEDGDLTNKINLTGDVKDEIGTYKVTLSVTDSKGATTTKEVTVKVIKRNEAPVINVNSTYKLHVGDKFDYKMLNATANDDYDGDLTSKIQFQGNVDTSKAGTYKVSVFVADSKDLMGQKWVTVVVEEAPNTDPTITADNITIEQGSKFDYSMLNAKATDKEDGDLTSKIQYKGIVNTAVPKTYTVTCSVEDSKGRPASVVKTVEVTEKVVPNEAPVLTADNVTITEGDAFNIFMLNINATDKEDGNITPNVKVVSNDVDNNKAGVYHVELSVTDSKGKTTTKTVTVTVKEKPEVNNAPTITAENVTINQGDKFDNSMLKAHANDKEDGDLTDKIVYNGNVDTNKAGSYTITLTVKDSKGETSTKTVTVTVKEKAESNLVDKINSSSFQSQVRSEMFRLVNAHRVANGIAPFESVGSLNSLADAWSNHMAQLGFCDHVDPNGQSSSDLYPSMAGSGENVLMTSAYEDTTPQSLAQDMFNMWKGSAGHNATMLNDWFPGFGFGYKAVCTDGMNVRVYATQEFGGSSADAPKPEAPKAPEVKEEVKQETPEVKAEQPKEEAPVVKEEVKQDAPVKEEVKEQPKEEAPVVKEEVKEQPKEEVKAETPAVNAEQPQADNATVEMK
ncbi:immunoglobulin-like domain-containing protein [Paraclostridium bifermentans]|uniref:immunoglobulin-like domain-containing protein n=1 Tax=Paraclostridium bifermentans TaxID=1490 RepID=UPI00374F61FE